MSKELLEKFNRGGGLTDAECLTLLGFFKCLEADLLLLGETYHLAWLSIMLNRRVIESFIDARRLR